MAATAALLGVAVLLGACARIEHRSQTAVRTSNYGLRALGAENARVDGASSSSAVNTEAGHAASLATGSQADATAIVPADDWPDRWPFLNAATDRPRGVIRAIDTPGTELELTWLRRGRRLAPTEDDHADVAALLKLLPDGTDTPGFFQTEGPGAFTLLAREPEIELIPPLKPGDRLGPELAAKLMNGTAAIIDENNPRDLSNEPHGYYKFVSAVPTPAPDASQGLALQRTWFAHYAPTDANEEPLANPRGVVVILPGMFGTPQNLMRSTALTFKRRGWHVVRMLVHPSRMTERTELAVLPGSDDAAHQLAELLDQRAAEAAYAIHAALDHLAAEHPGLGDLPHTLLGFSGGALLAPASAAYRPDRFDSAVLVAGGENVLEILDSSSYTNWINAIEIDWSRAPGSRGRVYDRYLIASKLDPAHTAKAFSGRPVLVLHADADAAVPASAGERLWRRLDRPERWRFPFGHELLFLVALPLNLSEMADWVEQHTPAPTGSNDRPEASVPEGGT